MPSKVNDDGKLRGAGTRILPVVANRHFGLGLSSELYLSLEIYYGQSILPAAKNKDFSTLGSQKPPTTLIFLFCCSCSHLY